MGRILTHIVVTAFSLILVSEFVPGIHIESIYVALFAALVLGVLNVLVRPILVILTLPVTILTLGLFLLVVNALLFWFAASFVPGFTVEGFLPALIGSCIVSAVGLLVKPDPA